MSTLPFLKAYQIEDKAENHRWLIQDLWIDGGVGIIGGQPKSYKSFMALDMAVAVSSGRPCLRRYPVKTPGRVLLFAAEDSLSTVKERLHGICNAAGCELKDLDLFVITAAVLKIDIREHRLALTETVKELRPKLLILDPFIRMHNKDENNSGDMSSLLDYLRALNRVCHTSVALVHHANKRTCARPGQTLRGSSEFHAWGDSNLYLKRDQQNSLVLTVEHRSESSKDGIKLELFKENDILALRQIQTDKNNVDDNEDGITKIKTILSSTKTPLSLEEIRNAVHLRRNVVCDLVRILTKSGVVIKSPNGYHLDS